MRVRGDTKFSSTAFNSCTPPRSVRKRPRFGLFWAVLGCFWAVLARIRESDRPTELTREEAPGQTRMGYRPMAPSPAPWHPRLAPSCARSEIDPRDRCGVPQLNAVGTVLFGCFRTVSSKLRFHPGQRHLRMRSPPLVWLGSANHLLFAPADRLGWWVGPDADRVCSVPRKTPFCGVHARAVV